MNAKIILFCEICLLLACTEATQNYYVLRDSSYNTPRNVGTQNYYTPRNSSYNPPRTVGTQKYYTPPDSSHNPPRTVATQDNYTLRDSSYNPPQHSIYNATNNRITRIQSRVATNLKPPPNSNLFYDFNKKLFQSLGPKYSNFNMIYSPLSVQTLLGFVYVGAEDETARELRAALEIPDLPGEVTSIFQAALQHIKRQTTQDLQLRMVNSMFYSNHLAINSNLARSSTVYFGTTVEPTSFDIPVRAAAHINGLVADQTEQRIQNLVRPGSLGIDTQAILINAIYLKAKWDMEFSVYDTQPQEFHLAGGRTVPVDMMYLEENIKFSELPDLNANAIELPFKSSNLSMLILFPNEVNGLAMLEAALSRVDLKDLSSRLSSRPVTLFMPKFRFEFEVDMSRPLMELGISRLFSDFAQLNGFFNNQSVRVATVHHKAYINVNEGGVEAAATSFGKLLPLSVPVQMIYFKVDHPFVFVIKSPQLVHFVGHVVQP